MDNKIYAYLYNIRNGINVLESTKVLIEEISSLRREAEFSHVLTKSVKNIMHKEANKIERNLNEVLENFIGKKIGE